MKKIIITITFITLSTLMNAVTISITEGLKTVADSHGVIWTFTGYTTNDDTDSALITQVTLPSAESYDGILSIPDVLISEADSSKYIVTSIIGNPILHYSILGYATDKTIKKIDLSAAVHLTSIKDYAFFQFNALTGRLVIPDNVNYIGQDAFYNNLLTCVYIPDDVTYLGNDAFALCSKITNINIPTSLTYIGDYAFANCTGLKGKLNIPTNVFYIGQQAFYNCVGLTGNVIIPESVTAVNSKSFYGCIGLTSITYNSRTLDLTLAQDVFHGCSGLEFVNMSAATNLILPTTMFKLSRSSSNKDPFYNLPTHTIVYLPNSSKMNKTLVGTNINYIYNDVTNGWVCPSLALHDAYPYDFQIDFTAAKVTYDRVFTAKETTSGYKLSGFNGIAANTLYIPFSTSLPNNMSAYNFVSSNNNIIGMAQVEPSADGTTTLKSYTPYIIRFNTAATIGTQVTLRAGTNAKIFVTPTINTYVNSSSNALYGTLTGIDNTTAASMGAYNLEDNVWHPIQTSGVGSDGVTPVNNGHVGQFRCFLIRNVISAAAPQDLFLDFTDKITGINTVNKGKVTDRGSVYTVSGQYVGTDIDVLPKGMYIVNGKKVVKR